MLGHGIVAQPLQSKELICSSQCDKNGFVLFFCFVFLWFFRELLTYVDANRITLTSSLTRSAGNPKSTQQRPGREHARNALQCIEVGSTVPRFYALSPRRMGTFWVASVAGGSGRLPNTKGYHHARPGLRCLCSDRCRRQVGETLQETRSRAGCSSLTLATEKNRQTRSSDGGT